MDFDPRVRLGKKACEMLNNDRASEQVKVLQSDFMRWDTQVFVVCGFQ